MGKAKTGRGGTVTVLSTGLGAGVDRVAASSATLRSQLAQARKRWPKDLRIQSGKITARSARSVSIGPGDATDKALWLAHELGHLLNTEGVIPGGATFHEFVRRNVDAQVREEAAAMLAEIAVRKEFRRAGHRVAPRQEALAAGGFVNLEDFAGDMKAFLRWVRQVRTETTGTDSVETSWKKYFSTNQMKQLWRGLSVPKVKTPSSRLFDASTQLLASADRYFVPGPRPVPGGARPAGSGPTAAAAHAPAARAMRDFPRQHARELERLAAQRRADEAAGRGREQAERRAREEAARRGAERAAREAADGRAREERARRAREEAMRRQRAIEAARTRREVRVVTPMQYGPGPGGTLPRTGGRVITVIGGPPQVWPAGHRPPFHR